MKLFLFINDCGTINFLISQKISNLLKIIKSVRIISFVLKSKFILSYNNYCVSHIYFKRRWSKRKYVVLLLFFFEKLLFCHSLLNQIPCIIFKYNLIALRIYISW